MPTIKAILWTYEKRGDGTADVKIYTYPPKTYTSTGIKIKPVDWDKKRGRVKNTHPAAVILNAKIEGLLTEATIRAHNGRVGATPGLLAFLELFLEEIGEGLHDIGASSAKNYRALQSRVGQWCKMRGRQDLPMDDCTAAWHADFSLFLLQYGGCKAPGVGKHTKNLKRVLRTAEDRKLHHQAAYKTFSVSRHNTDKIYLRQEEINRLAALDLSHTPHLERERARFLVSYYLVMRYGDSVRIRPENAYQEGGRWFYRYISEKTTVPVVVPIKQAALGILQKNGWNMGEDTNQEANRHIKQICCLAGITEDAKEGTRTGQKWQFVTTHTARRSAATNMALDGVQIETIAKVGGWEKIGTLKNYLRASGLDVARVAATLDFFQ
jgi:site-specific recombinase XerD